MTDAELGLLAEQTRRLIAAVAGVRDDIGVLTAMVMRLDNTRDRHEATMLDILHEMRAIHVQIGRMNDRIMKLEEVK